jgi:hypothetical protein
MATDGVEVVSLGLSAEVFEPVGFCVEFRELRELVRIARNDVELSGTFIEFPELDAVPVEALETPLPDNFCDLVSQAAAVIDRSNYRQILQGVNLSAAGITATDGKQLSFLLNEGNTHTDQQGAHAVHKTGTECADNGTGHVEIGVAQKIECIFKNRESDTGCHGCRKEDFPFIGNDDSIVQNRQSLKKFLGNGSNNSGNAVHIHRQYLRKHTVDFRCKDRNEYTDQQEHNRQARLLFDQHSHQHDRNENRYEQNINHIVHFSTPFFAAIIVATQRIANTIAVTARCVAK